MMTIEEAFQRYLAMISSAKSENTHRTYTNAIKLFAQILSEKGMDPSKNAIDNLSEDAIIWLSEGLKYYTPATEQLYITVVAGFYEFLVAENLHPVNLPRLRLLIRKRTRSAGVRLPQFEKEKIEAIIVYAINLALSIDKLKSQRERLIALRDRAFILTLADTGLRVHEACNLRRGDIDWHEAKAIIIGKGDRQAVVRFSKRSLRAISDYLAARQALDGGSGKPLSSLPLFARHDKRAGNKVLPITTTSGRNIVNQRALEATGDKSAREISPHSFRHYFVTRVLLASGGNIKLAQELARHQSISVTQRYAHLADDELDRSYWEIFEED